MEGRVGVFNRMVTYCGGTLLGINMGYQDINFGRVEHYENNNTIESLWRQASNVDTTGMTAKDIKKVQKEYKDVCRTANIWKNTIYANSMIPKNVPMYQHKIRINNSKNRSKGLRCLLRDGEYTLLSIGKFGWDTEKWKMLIGDKRVVGEDAFFDMMTYQMIHPDVNTDTIVRELPSGNVIGTKNDDSGIEVAGVYSCFLMYYAVFCNDESTIEQLKAAIRRGVVTATWCSPKEHMAPGLGLLILDESYRPRPRR